MSPLHVLSLFLFFKFCHVCAFGFKSAFPILTGIFIDNEPLDNTLIQPAKSPDADYELAKKRVERLKELSSNLHLTQPPLPVVNDGDIIRAPKYYMWFYFHSNYILPKRFWLKYFLTRHNIVPKYNNKNEKPFFRYYLN